MTQTQTDPDMSMNQQPSTMEGIGAADAAIVVDGCDTLVKLWQKKCLERGKQVAHREKDLGIWQSYSWQNYYDAACKIGMGLVELGLEAGQCVSILSEDNKEWLYVDMGVCAVGGIPNGVYTTDSPEQLAYLVNDSGSCFLFVENDEQLHKYLETKDQMPSLKKVIVFERKGLRDFQDPMVMFLDELYVLGDGVEHAKARFDEAIKKTQPEDVRTLIYTSGTTGHPKGAMITHRNVLFVMLAGEQVIEVKPTDEQLCFLPLCHVLERTTSVDMPIHKGCTVNFAESTETVFENLREVSPNTFTAVPRLWEKIYATISNLRADAGRFSQWAYDSAIKTGLAYHASGEPNLGLTVGYKFWDVLVLSRIREMLGMKNIRRAVTGAAPISKELIDWFRAIGVPIFEGYGMTETTAVISINHHQDNRVGSVGKPMPHTEVKLSEAGEILVKGNHVFAGYWKKPEKTNEDIRNGWLHTGDMGVLEDGFLTITGRIKDIIITAGGKNITPAAIESKLKFSPYIADAVVIGDQRKYLTCLIMIDQENVEKYAQDHHVAFSDFKSLCHTSEVQTLIDSIVQDTNQSFAQVEQIKYFRLIDTLLTAEDDELTATMKLKRNLVEKKHKALIDTMY